MIRTNPSDALLKKLRGIFDARGPEPFLIDPPTGRSITYDDLGRMAANLAHELEQRGVRKGDRVALLMPNCLELVLFYFACLLLGVTIVPINPDTHVNDIGQLIGGTHPVLIIYTPIQGDLIKSLCRTFEGMIAWCVDPDIESTEDTLPLNLLLDEESATQFTTRLESICSDNILSITFTSGTTGTPKGIAHTVNSLFSAAAAFNELLGMGPHNRMLHVLPMSYMAGFLNTLLCPFMAGGSVVLGGNFDARMARGFWNFIAENDVNTLWLTPTIITTIMRMDRGTEGEAYCHSNNLTICVGTAPLSSRARKDFENRYDVELLLSYGLSEVLYVTSNTPSAARVADSVGRFIEGVTWKIICEESASDKPDSGELWLKSPYVMTGYIDFDTGRIDDGLSEDWFVTGDLAQVDGDGNLFIVGRKKNLIIRGGVNISPKYIEDVVLLSNIVEQVAVVGIPHPVHGEDIAAAVVIKPGNEGETVEVLRTLNQFCRQHLKPGNIPARFEIFETLPKGATGKILRTEVKKIIEQTPATESGVV